MVGHEGGNKVVAVVVTALQAEIERDARLRAGAFEQFRAKLFLQEWVGVADVDQEIRKSRAVLDQRDRVMLAPRRFVVAEITAQRLDAPWRLRWRGDRRKYAGRAVTAGIRQRDRQRAVAAHRMS